MSGEPQPRRRKPAWRYRQPIAISEQRLTPFRTSGAPMGAPNAEPIPEKWNVPAGVGCRRRKRQGAVVSYAESTSSFGPFGISSRFLADDRDFQGFTYA